MRDARSPPFIRWILRYSYAALLKNLEEEVMTIVRKLFLCSVGIAVAVAAGCGGSTSDGGGGNVDAGTGTDSSVAADTSTGADTGTTPDTGGGMGTVACGMGSMCDVATQVCCVTAGEGGLSTACTGKTACTGGAIACESSSNCSSGQVCCVTLGMGTIEATCGAGPCAQGQLCAMSSECSMGEVCRQSQIGLNACLPPRMDGGTRDGGRRDGGPADAGGGG